METTGTDALQRAAKLLAGLDGGFERAAKAALSKTVSGLHADSVKAIRERYAISAANIRANETVSIRYSYQNGVQALVSFAGRKIPLYRFDGASPAQPTPDTGRLVPARLAGGWRMVHPGITASGHQLKSTPPKRLQNAFVARMKSGHVGIFERTGGSTSSSKDALRELYGASVPQMLGNPEVAGRMGQNAMAQFSSRLEDAVLQILNGWGR